MYVSYFKPTIYQTHDSYIFTHVLIKLKKDAQYTLNCDLKVERTHFDHKTK